MPKPGNKKSRSVSAPPPDSDAENDDPDIVAMNGATDGTDIHAPRQDPRERRAIRQNYARIRDEIQANREDFIRPNSDGLHAKLADTEHQFKKVKEAREAAMDSSVVALISRLAKQQVQALHTDFCVFDAVEFSQKLITLIAGNQLTDMDRERVRLSKDGWIKLGEAAQPFFKRTPPLHSLFGTFERGAPVKKVKVPREKEKDDNSAKGPTEPKQLASFKDMDTNQEVTTQEVERVYSLLKEHYHDTYNQSPICYFSFIINPHSFGLTIENLFHCSFLIRDGLAKISLDEDQLPVIEPVDKNDTEEEMSRLPRHQAIISMTQVEWREIVKTFQITEAMIPSRSQAVSAQPSTSGTKPPRKK